MAASLVHVVFTCIADCCCVLQAAKYNIWIHCRSCIHIQPLSHKTASMEMWSASNDDLMDCKLQWGLHCKYVLVPNLSHANVCRKLQMQSQLGLLQLWSKKPWALLASVTQGTCPSGYVCFPVDRYFLFRPIATTWLTYVMRNKAQRHHFQPSICLLIGPYSSEPV